MERETSTSSSIINLSKLVTNIKNYFRRAAGGWSTCKTRKIRKEVNLDGLDRWIELVFIEGLTIMKKAELISELKDHHNITKEDIEQAYIVIKNGCEYTLPDNRVASDIAPRELVNHILKINQTPALESSSEEPQGHDGLWSS